MSRSNVLYKTKTSPLSTQVCLMYFCQELETQELGLALLVSAEAQISAPSFLVGK